MRPFDPLTLSKSPVMHDLFDEAARFAVKPYPLLILGARGTGKTWLAKYIHAWSGRSGPFVRASAAGLQPGLEIAELVGHVKGGFTGATADLPGLIERAHRGTLFIDEIGDAPPGVQEALLTMIEDSAVRPVRGQRDIPVNVRFVAATNADLAAKVEAGRFRQDLLARFGIFVLHMPELADRRDDILPLAHHFLEVLAAEQGWPGLCQLSAEIEDLLRAAPWPGNVRGLLQACQFFMCHAQPGQMLRLHDLPAAYLQSIFGSSPARASDLDLVQEKLRQVAGNKSAAARSLKISRTQIYRILKRKSEG